MEKSHVAMENQLCLVCGESFETGSILLDKRLRKSLSQPTVTGWGLCEEHQKMNDDGYIALVGIDPEKSQNADKANKKVNPEDAYRTGSVAHLRRSVAQEILNVPEETLEGPILFVEQEVIDLLASKVS